MRNIRIWLLSIASAVLVAGPAVGQEDAETRDCISLNRLDDTEVIDDRTILFFLKNDEIYVNRLRNRCHGLGFEESFMYETSTAQLCNLDLITVLRDMGFGFSRGASCGLTTFHRISEADAESLQARGER